MWVLVGGALALGAVGDTAPQPPLAGPGQPLRGLAVTGDDLTVLDVRGGGTVVALEGDPLQPGARSPLPRPMTQARGWTTTEVDGGQVGWVFDWIDGEATLHRQDLRAGTATSVAGARLGVEAPPTALVWHGETLWVATVPTSQDDGLVRIDLPDGGWDALLRGDAPTVRILPGLGLANGDGWRPYRALAVVPVEGVSYLFAAAWRHVVALEARTGRALFTFDVPRTLPGEPLPVGGLAFVHDDLWALERSTGGARLHRVTVTRDLDETVASPWTLRHLNLRVTTTPKPDAPRRAGTVQHTFGHPATLPSQQAIEGTRVARELGGDAAQHTQVRWSPADDPAVEQLDDRFTWADGRPVRRAAEVEVRARFRSVRSFVYPHRVTGDGAPPGYTADSVLYRLDDDRTYERFLERVRSWLGARYGLTDPESRAELAHPYWAARDVTEFIFAHYWYPVPDKGLDTTQDPERGHFQGSPATAKLRLSERDSTDAIVACNGGNVMIDGVLRYLGHPARWLGSTHGSGRDATRRDDDDAHWDHDGDGFLDPDERMVGVHGHRWTQAWLGPHYGWQTFDATPEARAPEGDRRRVPTPRQWDLMRDAAGGVPGTRVVLTVGSGVHEPLFRTFAPPIEGGDQGFSLMGKLSHPQHWRYPAKEITWSTPLSLGPVQATRDGGDITVTWAPEGPWTELPGATVEVWAERWTADGPSRDRHRLGTDVPVATGALTGPLPPGPWRLVVHQTGDRQVGARSHEVR